jgi:sugar/nucleoside kinase (ribokinase family)
MRLSAAILGDAVVDVQASGAEPRAGRDVPAAIRLEPGGQGANLAVRRARRGVAVRLGCARAADATGRVLRERLTAEGVEVVAAPADRTGAVVVLVAPNGERAMLSQRVPLLAAFGADRLASLVADVDWVAISGYVLLEPDARTAVSPLAGRPGSRAVLGCALTAAQAAAWRAAAGACGPSLLVLNADEVAALTAIDRPADAAARLAEELSATVVVTEPGGAVAVVRGTRVAASAPRTGDVVDTTGAGDAFAAALLASLGSDELDAPALERALAAAVRAGTAATRTVGAQGRIPGERDPDRLTP